MRVTFFILFFFFASLQLFSQENYTPAAQNIASRKEFSEARFGIFIHWGLYSMVGDGEWVMHNKNINHKEYEKLAGAFYPSKFNAAEWVSAIKGSGAKYLCITSRHHDGFSLFKTSASPYNSVDATPFGRDILAEIAQECHKQGIRLHFYYSHLDWGREDYYPLGRTGHGTGRTGYFKGEKLPETDPKVFTSNWAYENYLKFMDTQLEELLTNYGKIGAIWFDGVWDRDKQENGLKAETWNLASQYSLIHRLQPGCLVGNNHHMDPFPGEDIQIFERDIPGQNLYGYSEQAISNVLPLETCQTMNRSWGYRLTDTTYKTEEFLIKYLVQTAAKGANLLLNIGPRPDGTLPDESLERLEAMGEWLGRYGGTIYGTSAGMVPEQSWGVSTRKGHRHFLHIFKDTTEIFVPIKEGTKVVECKEYISGRNLEFRKVEGGLKIILSTDMRSDRGIRVVELVTPAADKDAMRVSVENFLERYPEATLQDIYKNNFQDYFGPAHIMARRENVVAYLKSELEQMEQEKVDGKGKELSGSGYYTPCGWRKNWWQVDLAVVTDGKITLEEFADAFMEGGGGAPEVTDEWMNEWNLLKRTVKEIAPGLVGYKDDVKKITSLIEEGNYVVHHSSRYESAYMPHYRIIRRDIFESVILPRLKD